MSESTQDSEEKVQVKKLKVHITLSLPSLVIDENQEGEEVNLQQINESLLVDDSSDEHYELEKDIFTLNEHLECGDEAHRKQGQQLPESTPKNRGKATINIGSQSDSRKFEDFRTRSRN